MEARSWIESTCSFSVEASLKRVYTERFDRDVFAEEIAGAFWDNFWYLYGICGHFFVEEFFEFVINCIPEEGIGPNILVIFDAEQVRDSPFYRETIFEYDSTNTVRERELGVEFGSPRYPYSDRIRFFEDYINDEQLADEMREERRRRRGSISDETLALVTKEIIEEAFWENMREECIQFAADVSKKILSWCPEYAIREISSDDVRVIYGTECEILVYQAQGGDSQAFGKLVQRYERLVYDVASRILRRPEDAEDVKQDAFTNAFEHLHALRALSKFSAWLRKITINLARERLRTRPQDPLSLEENVISLFAPNHNDPVRNFRLKEIRGGLALATDELRKRPKLYSVFQLRHPNKLRFKEIGRRLGIKEGTARWRYLEALRVLRETLQKLYVSIDDLC